MMMPELAPVALAPLGPTLFNTPSRAYEVSCANHDTKGSVVWGVIVAGITI